MALKSLTKTYAGMYQGYVYENGIQLILFQCFDVNEVESLCKEYSVHYRNIYVQHLFNCSTLYKFKL